MVTMTIKVTSMTLTNHISSGLIQIDSFVSLLPFGWLLEEIWINALWALPSASLVYLCFVEQFEL